MAKINLNAIRTGKRRVDRLISAGQAIASNPAAATSIIANEAQNILTVRAGPVDRSGFDTLPSNPQQRGALAPLYKQRKMDTPIMFPDDLDADHYMLFKVKQERRLTRTVKRINDIRVIALPIPGNLAVSYAADYENASLGVAGAMLGGQMSLEQLKGGLGSIKDEIIAGGKDLLGQVAKGKANDATKEVATGIGIAAGVTALAGIFGGPLVAAIGGGDLIGGAVKGVGKRLGKTLNPHQAVIFQGVGFKEHSFSYKFVARNEQESRQIQAICTVFRYHMLPSYANEGLAFNYPHEFEIEFSDVVAPFLYRIGTCVLKSFNVTYNGGGVPQFYSNTNAPIEVEIQLGFQEVHIETSDAPPPSGNTGDRRDSGFGDAGKQILINDHYHRNQT